MYEFETPRPVKLVSRSGAGKVTVRAQDVTTSTVELVALRGHDEEHSAINDALVELSGDTLNIEVGREKGGFFKGKPQIGITVVVPLDSSARIEANSADFITTGRLDKLSAKTGSGDIEAADATTMDLRTGSGDITIGECRENLEATTGSGDTVVDHAGTTTSLTAGSGDMTIAEILGKLNAKLGSGDVVIKHCSGDIDIKSGSGDMSFRRADAGSISAATASGDVKVGVTSGTAVWLDVRTVTGDVNNKLDDIDSPAQTDQTLEVRIKTATGDVNITRV